MLKVEVSDGYKVSVGEVNYPYNLIYEEFGGYM